MGSQSFALEVFTKAEYFGNLIIFFSLKKAATALINFSEGSSNPVNPAFFWFISISFIYLEIIYEKFKLTKASHMFYI